MYKAGQQLIIIAAVLTNVASGSSMAVARDRGLDGPGVAAAGKVLWEFNTHG